MLLFVCVLSRSKQIFGKFFFNDSGKKRKIANTPKKTINMRHSTRDTCWLESRTLSYVCSVRTFLFIFSLTGTDTHTHTQDATAVKGLCRYTKCLLETYMVGGVFISKIRYCMCLCVRARLMMIFAVICGLRCCCVASCSCNVF